MKKTTISSKKVFTAFALGLIFTVTIQAQSPGGVPTTNLNLWLRSDIGVTNSGDGSRARAWADQSAEGNNATSRNRDPLYRENTIDNINFNPVVEFLASNEDALQIASNLNIAKNTIQDFTLFAVARYIDGQMVYLGSQPNAFGAFQFGVRSETDADVVVWRYNRGSQVVDGQDGLYPTTAEKVAISTAIRNGNTGTDYVNGKLGTNTTSSGVFSNTSDLRLGNGGGNNNVWSNLELAELIAFDDNLSATNQQQVESYLALKYGITLDQSSATNYLASNGSTIIWDSGISATHNNDIFGLGKDTGSSLDQRISKPITINSVLTASSDTNFTTTNTAHTDILNDLEFVMHANNANGAALAIFTTDLGGDFTDLKKLNREWNIQEVGDVGCINYKFDVSGLGLSASDLLYVATAEDPTFSTNLELKIIDSTLGEVSIDWAANSSNNYMTLAVLAAAGAGKASELIDTKIGISTLTTPNLPTASNTYLELESRNLGMVITRVSTANRIAMTQQPGLFVFDTDLNQFLVSNGTSWRAIEQLSQKFCD